MIGGLIERLRRRRPTADPGPDPIREGLVVGACGSCAGPVVYSRVARAASCPCGASRVPREFLLLAEVKR